MPKKKYRLAADQKSVLDLVGHQFQVQLAKQLLDIDKYLEIRGVKLKDVLLLSTAHYQHVLKGVRPLPFFSLLRLALYLNWPITSFLPIAVSDVLPDSQLPVLLPNGFLQLDTSRGKSHLTRVRVSDEQLSGFSGPITIPAGLIWLQVSGETVSLAIHDKGVSTNG